MPRKDAAKADDVGSGDASGNLSKYEVKEFKEAFALFDANKDGVIDHDEIKALSSSLGEDWKDKEVKGLIDSVDTLGTGTIDFPSFLAMFQHQENEDPLQMVDEAWDLIATKGSELITNQDLKTFLANAGQNIIDTEADEMIKLCDKAGKGGICLDDFKTMWAQTEAEKQE